MSPTFIGTNTGAKTTTDGSDAQYPTHIIIIVIFSDNPSSSTVWLNTAFRIFSQKIPRGTITELYNITIINKLYNEYKMLQRNAIEK